MLATNGMLLERYAARGGRALRRGLREPRRRRADDPRRLRGVAGLRAAAHGPRGPALRSRRGPGCVARSRRCTRGTWTSSRRSSRGARDLGVRPRVVPGPRRVVRRVRRDGRRAGAALVPTAAPAPALRRGHRRPGGGCGRPRRRLRARVRGQAAADRRPPAGQRRRRAFTRPRVRRALVVRGGRGRRRACAPASSTRRVGDARDGLRALRDSSAYREALAPHRRTAIRRASAACVPKRRAAGAPGEAHGMSAPDRPLQPARRGPHPAPRPRPRRLDGRPRTRS